MSAPTVKQEKFTNYPVLPDQTQQSKILSESSPEISTCESDIAYSRYTPSMPCRQLFRELQRYRCLESDYIYYSEHGDGYNFSNFVDLDCLSSSGNSLEHSLIQVVGITESGAYIESASTVIQFASPARTVATLMEKIVGPVSAGSLRLASTDVKVNPIVQFNYFNCPVDGTRKIGDVLLTKSMDDFKFLGWFGNKDFRFIGPALPVDQSDFDQMADFCRRTVSTIWHYHGGCIAGKVVDGDFRVIGIDALRTFGILPGTNPQATLLMLGRYVGQKIMINRKGGYKMVD